MQQFYRYPSSCLRSAQLAAVLIPIPMIGLVFLRLIQNCSPSSNPLQCISHWLLNMYLIIPVPPVGPSASSFPLESSFTRTPRRSDLVTTSRTRQTLFTIYIRTFARRSCHHRNFEWKERRKCRTSKLAASLSTGTTAFANRTASIPVNPVGHFDVT